MQVNVTNETNSAIAKTSTASTSNEQDFNKEQEQLQTSTVSKSETKDADAQNAKEEEEEEDITASFTIITPSTGTKTARPSSLIVSAITTTTTTDNISNDEEVSATIVMSPRKESRTPTPTTENVETTLVVEPQVTNSPMVETTENKHIEFLSNDGNDIRLKHSTHNKENENYENEKTEPPPPTSNRDAVVIPVTESTALQEQSTKIAHHLETPSQRAQSSERIRAPVVNPLPLATQITTITTPTSSTTSTPTLDSPVRLRDKRSIFDTDNASPHTLADKLRGEANKYAYDEKRYGIFDSFVHDSSLERDTSSSPSNCNSRRSLDSASLPNSPLHTRDREAGGNDNCSGVGGGGGGGNGGNFNSNLSADRRPSWRLKFDSGSKVGF